MNMLTSLKALLFSSAPGGSAAQVTTAMPAVDAVVSDFAAILDGTMALPAAGIDSPPAPALTEAFEVAPVPATKSAPPKAMGIGHVVLQGVHGIVPSGSPDAVKENRDKPRTLPPGLALGLVKHGKMLQPVPQPQAGGTEEVPTQADAAPMELQLVSEQQPEEAVTETSQAPAKPRHARGSAGIRHEAQAEKEPSDKAAVPADDAEQPRKKAESPTSFQPNISVDPVPQAVTPPAPAPVDNLTPQPTSESGRAVIAAAPQIQPVAQEQPLPVQGEAPVESHGASASQPDSDKADTAPVLNGKPVKAEAMALLQLVREQVAARQTGASVRVGEQVSAIAGKQPDQPAPRVEIGPDLSLAARPADAAPQPIASTQPPVTLAAVPSAPTVDLSASLGAQVVDMGVSGQWIDGLARDLAGLSANGAQGRFQINADQLGAVQVDIRQGTDGAAVSLTVASEAAEMALRQDSDRLKLDAGLSAVRIAEVRVERAAPVAESQRADMGNQQSSQQQQGSQAGSAWQNNNSQNMGQPQGQQGRWQPRENGGFGSKSSGDPAVLDHAEARQGAGETVRTRYA